MITRCARVLLSRRHRSVAAVASNSASTHPGDGRLDSVRRALEECGKREDWVTARDIWTTFILGRHGPASIDSETLDRFCTLALKAKDVRGAYAVFAAGRRRSSDAPRHSTYHGLIEALLDNSGDPERAIAAIVLLEDLKGAGNVSVRTLASMLKAYGSAGNVKALDALATFIQETWPKVPLVLQGKIVESYWAAAAGQPASIQERMEGAFGAIVRLVSASNLEELASDDLHIVRSAAVSYLDYLASQPSHRASLVLWRLRDLRDVLQIPVVAVFERASKFTARSAELLEFLRSLDIGILRALVGALRSADEAAKAAGLEAESGVVGTLRNEWMPFLDSAIYRHGVTGLGFDGVRSIMHILLGPGGGHDRREALDRAQAIFFRLRDEGLDAPAEGYRILMEAWASRDVPDGIEAGEKLDRVASLVGSMKAAGHPITEIDYAYMFRACVPLGKVAPLSDELLHFLAQTNLYLEETKGSPPAGPIRTFRRAFSAARDMDPRISFVEAHLSQSGLRYDENLLCELVRALCAGSGYGSAFVLLKLLRTAGLPLGIKVYNALLELCSNSKSASQAALGSLRFDITRHGLRLDADSYGALLKCCATLDDEITAAEIAEEMAAGI